MAIQTSRVFLEENRRRFQSVSGGLLQDDGAVRPSLMLGARRSFYRLEQEVLRVGRLLLEARSFTGDRSVLRFLVASDGDDTGVILPVVPGSLPVQWTCGLFQSISVVRGSAVSVEDLVMTTVDPRLGLGPPTL